MLGADAIVIQHPGFLLRQDNDPPRPISEHLEHAAHRRSQPVGLSRRKTRYIASVLLTRPRRSDLTARRWLQAGGLPRMNGTLRALGGSCRPGTRLPLAATYDPLPAARF